MKRNLLLYIAIFWSTVAFSQTGVLKGSVRDAETKAPLELATVSVYREDSSLITYKLSDKEGKFAFDRLPVARKTLIAVTYTGFDAQYRSVILQPGKQDTLHFLLEYSKDTAVVVSAKIPIRMNGDTLEISPDAFKMKADAVVEELLNQVSGITIWSDGSITVNGKKVQSLLVDGKPFFGSTDSRVITQNLPKTAIDKIQLYQEYDRSNIGQVTAPVDSLLTMNIKLKEGSKKGYFGKAGAGVGNSDRFESDFTMQMYTKRSSGGIGGGFNNINKNIGSLQEMFSNNTYRNYNPNLYNVGRFGGNGINKNHSIGGVFTHNFIESTNSRQNNRITFNYNKSGTDNYTSDISLQNRSNINNPQLIKDVGEQNFNNNTHAVGLNYVKTNSFNDNLSVNTGFNSSRNLGNSTRFTEVRDSAGQLQNTNRSVTFADNRIDNQSLSLNFAKSDRDHPLKGFSIQADFRRSNNLSERAVNSDFESMIDVTKNASYDRHYTIENNTLGFSGNFDYAGFKRLLLGRYNLFGINLNFNQRVNFNSQEDDSDVADLDNSTNKYVTNSKLSNQNKRELFEYTPALSLSKNFFKYSDRFSRNINLHVRLSNEVKTEKNSSSIADRNLSRSFNFLTYNGNVNFNYQKQKNFNFNTSAGFSRNFGYPTVDQLYTISDDINVYDTRIGNPNLKNRINHNLNFNSNFNTQKPEAIYSFNGSINGNYGRSKNPIVDSTINNASGRRTVVIINADKSSSYNFNGNFNVSRKLKKNALQLMLTAGVSRGQSPNYIDGFYNLSSNQNFYTNFNFQYTHGSVLVLTAGRNYSQYSTKQTAKGLIPFKNENYANRFGVVVNYPKNFTFSSTLDYGGNSNIDNKMMLWNSFITYRFMKQQGELKLSAMDILKQYENISNFAGTYGTTTRISNGLQQYFLLTFSYYPRKFGKTEIKRQGS